MEHDAVRSVRRGERGIALALVLAVLVCLLAVAIPFSLSMRHEQGGVVFRSSDDQARRAAAAVRDFALQHHGDTAPDRDATPWSDSDAETAVDLDAAAKSLGMTDLGPRGRLLSADLEDQSGRIDLERANLFLLARTLGLSTTLSSALKADDKEIRLVDGDFLQDEGFLWIDGEVTLYHRKDGAAVTDFVRPAVVPGFWEPATMKTDPRAFEAGTEVLDFRAYMVAAWLFKANPGRESRFETLSEPLAIERFGHGALGAEQRARLEKFCTLWHADGGRDRFGLATRVLRPVTAGQTRGLSVEQAHFAGPGTLARVTTYEGKVDYGFVLRNDSGGPDGRTRLELEMPLTIQADAGQAIVEFLLPRPVNVNSCTRETLLLLLTGLKLRGQTEVDAAAAERVADRLVAARPLAGMRDVEALLSTMVKKEKVLKQNQAIAILVNAEHSGSFALQAGTAPFCFASEGVFDVRAAASLNYPLNGREKARAFEREIVATAGAGRSDWLFKTQRDFEEPWRITRLARDWTTFPENLQTFDFGIGSADPPSRVPTMVEPRERFASEQLNETGARLAAGRMTVKTTTADRTWHFDSIQGDYDSKDPDGWRLADGPLHFGVNGGEQGVELVQSSSGPARPKPFGVSMWWNPGHDLGSEQTLVDWKCNARAFNPELQDRVRLRLRNRKLEFEVDDAFLRESQDDRYTAKIVYDFTDGLSLEADTWYHVTVFCRGNRAGQTTLWIDGKPRGKYSHYTRLKSNFDAASTSASKVTVDSQRLAEQNKFPTRSAIRVGTDVVEYSEVTPSSFTVMHDDVDHFGGRRPQPNPAVPGASASAGRTGGGGNSHQVETGVELYGYSSRLGSDVPSGSNALDADGLGKFAVAMVDLAMAKTPIVLQGNRGPITLGTGFEEDANEVDLKQLDGNDLQTKDKPFLKNGGYALLVSYDMHFRIVEKDPGGGADNNVQQDDVKTSKGSLVDGVEVIWYASYDGKKLTGVRRGWQLQQELAKTDFWEQDKKIVFPYAHAPSFCEKHAWLQTTNPRVFPNYKPGIIPVFVVPVSVHLTGSQVSSHLLIPEVKADATDKSELVQIDSNFDAPDKDHTEWVRYNSVVQDNSANWQLLRSDPEQVNLMRFWLAGGVLLKQGQDSSNFDGNGGVDYVYQLATALKAGNAPSWKPGGSDYKTLVQGLNYENVNDPTQNRLAFRGVLQTGDCEHSGSAKVYPVFRVDNQGGRPGRYDEVTLVGSSGEQPERQIVNYSWPKPGAEDWPNHYHVAFLAKETSARFVKTPSPAFDAGTPDGLLAAQTYNADSRNFARLLKFPSGELPSVWDGTSQLTIGESSGGGKATPATSASSSSSGGGTGSAGPKIDELRLFAANDPSDLYAHGMYVLRLEITPQEQSHFQVAHDQLRFPSTTVGNMAGLMGIHADACVWQFGDDWIVGAQRHDGDPIVQDVASDVGRNRFGGTPGEHEAGETGMVLPWLCMTRLNGSVSASESQLPLADAAQFPRKGFALIDDEIVGYTELLNGGNGGSGGGAAQLYVPTYMTDPLGRANHQRGDAAFRARFGTHATTHANDAIVFFWPWRYADGYVPRCEIPEMAALELPIAARRAMYHSLLWQEQQSDALVSLVCEARVQGRGGFAVEPGADPDLFLFEKPGTAETPNRLDRQGDLLRLRFFCRYRDGACDPVDFTRNSWKRAPLLSLVGVEYVADRVVELHEESR
jgi:hypothetical protein